MVDFTRSVVWRFMCALLLLNDKLLHLVRASTIEDSSAYQACVADPSTCTYLCASRPSLLNSPRRHK
jgi:hypothetical protein